MLTNPDRTVLGVGPYRVQTKMLVECLKFIGSLLPAETRKDISTKDSFVAATSATVQERFVMDAVAIMPADVGGLTEFGADPRWFVHMFSRHARSVSVLQSGAMIGMPM